MCASKTSIQLSASSGATTSSPSDSVEIDNNEIHHWRGAGVRVLDGNGVINRANANTVQVHDNFIHHDQHPASSNCLSAANSGPSDRNPAFTVIDRDRNGRAGALGVDGRSGMPTS
jgi:hypothetical protein